ncbi:MAG: DUF1573 domain-containing protein [Pirellulaceae bacterium]|nr:DUF1573 domain-containing protein [Pirellulaceae bacterium]
MNARIRRVLDNRIWLTCLFGGMLALGIFAGTTDLSATRTGIEIREGDLDLGDVWIVSKHQHSALLKNASRLALQIEGFYTSCQCTSVYPEQIHLAPGAESLVQFTFDLSATVPVNWADGAPFEIDVRPVISGDGTTIPAWSFRGRARHFFTNLRGSLLLDANQLIQSPTRRLSATVELQPSAALEEVHAWTDHPFTDVTAAIVEHRVRLSFDFASATPAEAHDFLVFLSASLRNGTKLDGLSIRTIAPINDEWVVLPNVVAFGLLSPGETATAEARIASRLGTPVLSVRPDSLPVDNPAVVSTISLENDCAVVLICITPEKTPGFYNHLLEFRITGAKASSEASVKIPVTYQVIAGANRIRL